MDIRICFVGDSFVNGTGDPEYLGWAGRLCINARLSEYNIIYYNLGVRRDTSTDILSRWFNECLIRLPKEYDGRIIFSFGVNDTVVEENGRLRVNPKDSVENAYKILGASKSLFPTLMVGPPPVADMEHNERIENLSLKLSMVAQEIGVPYLDIFPLLKDSDIWMKEVTCNDGSHPLSGGYSEFAEIVKSWSAWWFK